MSRRSRDGHVYPIRTSRVSEETSLCLVRAFPEEAKNSRQTRVIALRRPPPAPDAPPPAVPRIPVQMAFHSQSPDAMTWSRSRPGIDERLHGVATTASANATRRARTTNTSCRHCSRRRRVSGTVRMIPSGVSVTAPTPPNEVTNEEFSQRALWISVGTSTFTPVRSNALRNRSTRSLGRL